MSAGKRRNHETHSYTMKLPQFIIDIKSWLFDSHLQLVKYWSLVIVCWGQSVSDELEMRDKSQLLLQIGPFRRCDAVYLFQVFSATKTLADKLLCVADVEWLKFLFQFVYILDSKLSNSGCIFHKSENTVKSHKMCYVAINELLLNSLQNIDRKRSGEVWFI